MFSSHVGRARNPAKPLQRSVMVGRACLCSVVPSEMSETFQDHSAATLNMWTARISARVMNNGANCPSFIWVIQLGSHSSKGAHPPCRFFL